MNRETGFSHVNQFLLSQAALLKARQQLLVIFKFLLWKLVVVTDQTLILSQVQVGAVGGGSG